MINQDDDEEDFMKVADLVPDIHYANIILKTYEIESVIVQDLNGKNKSQYYRSLYESSKDKKRPSF